MRCYKIVRKTRDGILKSGYVVDPYAVTYGPEETTTAPFGGLLAFATLSAALDFAAGPGGGVEVWLAEGEDPIELPRYAGGHQDEYEKAWSGTLELPPELQYQWPPETVAFRRIRLERLVRALR
jgi:hypothetical protein